MPTFTFTITRRVRGRACHATPDIHTHSSVSSLSSLRRRRRDASTGTNHAEHTTLRTAAFMIGSFSTNKLQWLYYCEASCRSTQQREELPRSCRQPQQREELPRSCRQPQQPKNIQRDASCRQPQQPKNISCDASCRQTQQRKELRRIMPPNPAAKRAAT